MRERGGNYLEGNVRGPNGVLPEKGFGKYGVGRGGGKLDVKKRL